jgi:hypothetical protein
MAYQLQKSSSQVKRDLELALVGNAQTLVSGNSSTARQFASAQQQVAAGNITYAGAATNISEAILLTNLQACFVAGAEPSRIMVTPSNSVIVAGFASAAGRYRTIPGEKVGDSSGIVNVVNFYVSPFGEQKVEINRFIKAKNTLVYDPKQWAKSHPASVDPRSSREDRRQREADDCVGAVAQAQELRRVGLRHRQRDDRLLIAELPWYEYYTLRVAKLSTSV